jgi:cytochrome c oxidase assembly protein subunit 15
MAAYMLWLAACLHALDAFLNAPRKAAAIAFALAAAVTIQAIIGILTLLYGVPIGLALLHQSGAILVLTIAIVHAQALAMVQASEPGPHVRDLEAHAARTPNAGAG